MALVVDVEDEVLEAGVEFDRAAAAFGSGIAAEAYRAGQRQLWQHAVNAAVDDVDDAAAGAAAVEQRRGTADDLDAIGDNAVDRHGMIFAERRGVERGQPVGQHFDALAGLPANDRSGRDGAEIGRADAGLFRQRLADTARLFERQGVAGEYGGRLGELFHGSCKRLRGNDDFIELPMLVLCGRARTALPEGSGRQQRRAKRGRD